MYQSLEEPVEVIDDSEDDDIMWTIAYGVALGTNSNKRCGPRGKPIDRTPQKELWSRNLAGNWDENGFKARVRVTRDTFEFILKDLTADFVERFGFKIRPVSFPFDSLILIMTPFLPIFALFLWRHDCFFVVDVLSRWWLNRKER